MKNFTLGLLLASNLAFNVSYAKAMGGISGGGGNVINPTPPKTLQDPREIRNIIRGSKQLLKKFIDAKNALYVSGSMDYDSMRMYSVIFTNDEDDLTEVMNELRIDIPLDKGCFDAEGTEFDGSSYNRKEHSICISAFRIAKNTDKYEVPIQSAALVMHEFSEVMGLSDEDAITLQKQVIDELKNW